MDTPTILYVEDDLPSQGIMKIVICEIMQLPNLIVFGDSENFLAKVEALAPAPTIIMLDIHVTPYTGFEMLAMLRQHPKYTQLPIIALTASVMSEEVEALQNAGFDGVIAKPVDIDSFPEMLNSILAGERV